MKNENAKTRKISANFSIQISISLGDKKTQILENTQKICISKNMRFILGILEATYMSTFFIFVFAMHILFFFATKIR